MGSAFGACPKCAARLVHEVGKAPTDPPVSVLGCEKCGHIWMPDLFAPASTSRACPQCESARVRFAGQANSGNRYFRCEDCKYLIIDVAKGPAGA